VVSPRGSARRAAVAAVVGLVREEAVSVLDRLALPEPYAAGGGALRQSADGAEQATRKS
jgi:hypothetical protein